MNYSVWIFEGVKLVCQLGGAALVGWLGVRWALARYKSEKTWEKRLSAYTEILTSISEMERVLDQLGDHGFARRDIMFGKEGAALDREYSAALKAALAAKGQAAILLPHAVTDILNDMMRDLFKAGGPPSQAREHIEKQSEILMLSKDKIVLIAKKELSIS